MDTSAAGGPNHVLAEHHDHFLQFLRRRVESDAVTEHTLQDVYARGLEKLDDVIFVGRPAFGQEESTITLFKLTPDGEAHRTKVVLGRSSVNQIEIKEGLQPGDQVILSDMSSYDQFDRVRLN